jgi:hypothetical protein
LSSTGLLHHGLVTARLEARSSVAQWRGRRQRVRAPTGEDAIGTILIHAQALVVTALGAAPAVAFVTRRAELAGQP